MINGNKNIPNPTLSALLCLRGIARPQYRLRVEEIRVFYDVSGATVEVLAIVLKPEAES